VSRRVEARTAPGRPRALFAPAQDADPYLVLARLLTEHLASGDDPAAIAERAGRAFGADLVAASQAGSADGKHDPTASVVDAFGRLGFRPELVVDGTGERMLLRRCPFRELAGSRPEVVCSIHLGILRGALDAVGAPLAAEALEPFVEPSLCVAHLARTVA
jgi:predicted ArsR family transcriptional regulator